MQYNKHLHKNYKTVSFMIPNYTVNCEFYLWCQVECIAATKNNKFIQILFLFSELLYFNIWYVSNYGSDENDCHSASTACRNLQMVLDRATDGADIYITSDTLSLGNDSTCIVNSSLSYTLSSYSNINTEITCGGV